MLGGCWSPGEGRQGASDGLHLRGSGPEGLSCPLGSGLRPMSFAILGGGMCVCVCSWGVSKADSPGWGQVCPLITMLGAKVTMGMPELGFATLPPAWQPGFVPGWIWQLLGQEAGGSHKGGEPPEGPLQPLLVRRCVSLEPTRTPQTQRVWTCEV